ncbi:MAG: VCBS repeat-containing protein, partial [Saprospiraceae bacterium]|nr:VCBS repeat-containing protein [Saprospiraceae bacterium]
ADVNADGWLDIYVCRSAAANALKRKNLLFINNGDLTFTEQAHFFGLDDPGYSTQAAFFDYDLDGDLDMYLLNHSVQEYAGFEQITPHLKNRRNTDYGDKLYMNMEGVLFADMSRGAGILSNVLGFGLGVAISDLNDDGWPDIYVSNDYNEQDYLYINNQDGTFKESLEDFIGQVPLFSMGSDIADFNNDGFTDIMTLDMLPEDNYRQKMVSGPDNYNKYQRLINSGFYYQSMRNMLQLNVGGGSFSEIGQLAGVSNTDWSWSSLFADFDNDGLKDLFVSNGYERDYTNMDFLNFMVDERLKQRAGEIDISFIKVIAQMPSIMSPNYIFQNRGDLTFTKRTKEWGFTDESLSNGAAYGDLDNDGDLDLVVNNINDEAWVYRNNTERVDGNNFLKVVLKGEIGNTFGIGAKVKISLGAKTLHQELIPTRGFQSSVDYVLNFGLGTSEVVDAVKVTWPDHRIQIIENVQVNQQLTLDQTEARILENEPLESANPLFSEIEESGLNYVHKENPFVDFKQQQLLPHFLSTQGPKLAVGDINNDGTEDVFVGGAKGSSGNIYIQTGRGEFADNQNFDEDILSEDVGALFFDADNDDDLDLYVVSGGADFTPDDPQLQDRLYFNNGNGTLNKSLTSLPPMLTSGSCVTAGDYDTDGDLDLFVGGRLIPGRYPLAPRSYILSNDGSGNFKDVTAQICEALEAPGLVTDALWTDFNGDDRVDLIIIGEWMKIRIFENSEEGLTEITDAAGTYDSEGWWNKIISDDFDNDGDQDYVLGNLGWNSQIKASTSLPACLFVKDFDSNGTLDPILCYEVQGKVYPAWSKDDLEGQIPLIKKKYVKYKDYADQTIYDIFSSQELQDTVVLRAKTFTSTYLENLGDNQFRLHELPLLAQIAPVYGIVSKDFNDDGFKDILLAGNFFGNRVKFGRYDANRGLVLAGNGKGDFSAIQSSTGLSIRGEVRDVEVMNMADGRELLIVAMNNGPLKSYSMLNIDLNN